jgi:hypothetical protein
MEHRFPQTFEQPVQVGHALLKLVHAGFQLVHALIEAGFQLVHALIEAGFQPVHALVEAGFHSAHGSRHEHREGNPDADHSD